MYLYNITLGNHDVAPGRWSHMIDEYGNHFLGKENISQRMRIDKSVDPSFYPPEGELEVEWSSANMQCYHLLESVRWTNSNKNMNPLLLNDSRPNKKPGHEQIVIYLVTTSNYKITRFYTNNRILQTFHKDNTIQGCAIVLDTEFRDKEQGQKIIEIFAYNQKNDSYKKISINFIEAGSSKINMSIKNVNDNEIIDKMKARVERYKGKYMGFKIVTKPGDNLTRTWIVDPKMYDIAVAKCKSKRVANANIIQISAESLDPNSQEFEQTVNLLKDAILEKRIRAVTLCGLQLPLKVVQTIRLLYVFNYDTEKDALSCRKSN